MTKRTMTLLSFAVMLILISGSVTFQISNIAWTWAETPWLGVLALVAGVGLLVAAGASARRT